MSSDKGGRREGTTQEVMNAKKALRQLTQLHKEINEDVLTAYKVYQELLENKDTKDQVRKAVAKEIISLFFELTAEAGDVLGKPTNRHEEKEQELAKAAKRVSQGSVVSFKGS